MILAVFIDFFLFSVSYSHLCITHNEVYQLSKTNFNMDKFRSYLDSLNTTQLTNNTLCRVDLTLSSSAPAINVRFYGLLTAGKRVDGEVWINTVFDAEDSRKKEILTTNSASYTCSGPDGCEKEFLLKYVKWIIQTTFEEFKQVIRSLMANETAPKGKYVPKNSTV